MTNPQQRTENGDPVPDGPFFNPYVSGPILGALLPILLYFMKVSRDKRNASAAKMTKFREMVIEVIAQIISCDDAGVWMTFLKDDAAPTLLSEFSKISSLLTKPDISRNSMDDVLRLSKLHRNELQTQKDEVVAALERLKNDT